MVYQYIRLKPYVHLTAAEEATYRPEIDESEDLFELVSLSMGEYGNSGDYQMYIIHAGRIERDGRLILDHDQLYDIYLNYLKVSRMGQVGNSVRWDNYVREVVRLQGIIEVDLIRERARSVDTHYTDAAQLAQWQRARTAAGQQPDSANGGQQSKQGAK